MKKTILYIAASTIGFGLMLTNCSKKADPAPAATTSTTGNSTGTTTTTSGTTTSNTTAGSTTTSTTAGSTSSTTSGSTTATQGGSGTFSVDGVKNIPSNMITTNRLNETFGTTVSSSNYTFYINFRGTNFAPGNYSVRTYSNSDRPDANQVDIEFSRYAPFASFYSSSTTNSSVTIIGRNVTFNDIKLKNYNGKDSINISGNYTFDN